MLHMITQNCKCTYSDKDAVEIPWLAVIHGGRLAEHLCEASQPRHPQDVDVVVAAERLKEREVNLQRNIVLVLLIGGQNAEHDTIWVSVDQTNCN